VGISSDNDEEVWRTFIGAQHMDWWEYIDLEGKVLEEFKVESFPTYVVVDKDGVVRFRQSGFGELTQGELEDAINKALKRERDPKLAAALAEGSPISEARATEKNAAPIPRPAKVDAALRDEKKDVTGSESASPGREAGVEGGAVTGNVYKNAALGMTFSIPQGWSAAKPEALRAVNERGLAAAQAAVQRQNPGLSEALRVSMPKIVLYTSRKGGEWDGQRLEIPHIRISVMPSALDSLELDEFENVAETVVRASGAKRSGPASEFQVNKHRFLRVDFERSVGAVTLYQSQVQTLAGDYVVTVEMTGYSREELQRVAASLETMVITDKEP
jgi:hypothetical protein